MTTGSKRDIFFELIRARDLSKLQSLVHDTDNGERAELVNSTNLYGATILHCAADMENVAIISWALADNGGRAVGFSNVLAKTSNGGQTALHVAARRRNLDVVLALVNGCKLENGERAKLLNAISDDTGVTIAHIAATNQCLPIIRWLFAKDGGRAAGFNNLLAESKQHRETALHTAASGSGSLEVFQAMVLGSNVEGGERSAFLHAADSAGWMPIHRAASSCNVPVMTWLFSKEGREATGYDYVGAKTTGSKDTIWTLAIRNGSFGAFKELVGEWKKRNQSNEELNILNDADGTNSTVLHLAVSNQTARHISFLLSDDGGRAAGFNNVLAKDGDGATALHLAVSWGDLKIISALVSGCKVENGERAALLNAVNTNGETILHAVAMRNSEATIFRWILSDEGDHGRANGFNNVLAKTVDAGDTALHSLVQEGDFEGCQELINSCRIDNGERSALLNAVADDGYTALHYAAIRERLDIANWLLLDEKEGGVRSTVGGFDSVFARTVTDGETALHLAVGTGAIPSARLIVDACRIEDGEQQTMLNAVNNKGQTILHLASLHGRLPMIKWMFALHVEGFDIDLLFAKRDNRGETVVHCAAQGGSMDCFEFLLSHCKTAAERLRLIHATDDNGWKIVHHATVHGRAELMLALFHRYSAEMDLMVNVGVAKM